MTGSYKIENINVIVQPSMISCHVCNMYASRGSSDAIGSFISFTCFSTLLAMDVDCRVTISSILPILGIIVT